MTRSARCCRLLASVAAVLTLAACSSDPDDPNSSAATSTATSASSSAPQPAPAPAGGDADATTGTAADGDVAADEDAEAQSSADEDAEAQPAVTDPPQPAEIDVVLSLTSWDPAAGVVASGYVSPVIEDGGTCTLELSRDGETVTAATDGLADASTTVCGGLQVAGDDLAAGTWTAVLRYESASATGEPAPLPIEVPA
jgi:hypothetical protein